jgi:hypothetical protein
MFAFLSQNEYIINIHNLIILGAEPVPCQINKLKAVDNQ